GGGARPAATKAAEDIRDADSDHRASERAKDIDPVVTEIEADEIWPEGARRVHRGAGDWASPQARERDVAADTQRAEDANVLCPRGGAEDDTDQHRREQRLHQVALPDRIAMGDIVRP